VSGGQNGRIPKSGRAADGAAVQLAPGRLFAPGFLGQPMVQTLLGEPPWQPPCAVCIPALNAGSIVAGRTFCDMFVAGAVCIGDAM
jgi:hypothetical protein